MGVYVGEEGVGMVVMMAEVDGGGVYRRAGWRGIAGARGGEGGRSSAENSRRNVLGMGIDAAERETGV